MQFLGAIKKWQVCTLLYKTQKWQKTPQDSAVTEANWVQIPMFLHVPRAHEQGQICICGFVSKICTGKKLLRF